MTEEEFLSDPRYPYKEFLEDFLALGLCAPATIQPEEATRRLEAHFLSRYPDPKTRAWRYQRCSGAVAFWMTNREVLDVENLSVLGSQEALIGGKMMLGLWFFWITDSAEPVQPPSVEAFIELCDVIEKLIRQ